MNIMNFLIFSNIGLRDIKYNKENKHNNLIRGIITRPIDFTTTFNTLVNNNHIFTINGHDGNPALSINDDGIYIYGTLTFRNPNR